LIAGEGEGQKEMDWEREGRGRRGKVKRGGEGNRSIPVLPFPT